MVRTGPFPRDAQWATLAAELGCRVLDVFCENLITPLDFRELRDRFTEAK